MHKVKTNKFEEWEQKIKETVNPNVQAVVCILPGSKQRSPLYKDVKSLLLTQIPVPSQCVLLGTLHKEKGFRSVVNKILIQICAKIGGEPWAIDNMPFTSKPTMVCSYEIYGVRDLKFPFLAFTATYNKNLTKYVTYLKTAATPADIEKEIRNCISEAIKNFKVRSNMFPDHIIIFRDSICLSQLQKKPLPQYKFN